MTVLSQGVRQKRDLLTKALASCVQQCFSSGVCLMGYVKWSLLPRRLFCAAASGLARNHPWARGVVRLGAGSIALRALVTAFISQQGVFWLLH